VTDQGHLLRATMLFGKDGCLEGLSNVSLQRLREINGKYLLNRPDKRDQDAEAIERLADGSYLVSFEVTHRVLHYARLRDRPTLFSMPPGIKNSPRNGGLEAVTPLPDGRILVLTEKSAQRERIMGCKGGRLYRLDTGQRGGGLGRVFWPASGL
jgi:hypothetical protein